MSELLLDAAGRRRSPATLPEFHAGRPPRNKGMRYPADPPTIEEIVTVMRHAGDGVHGRRLRGLIVVLGALACGSARRSRSPRPTWTRAADRCWCGAARAAAAARSAWTTGPGSSLSPGSRRGSSCRSDRCSASSTAPRAAALGGRRRPLRAAPRRPRGRRAATLRAAPAAPRARRRDGPRGRAADRHPTPARPHQPRHHLHLPPRIHNTEIIDTVHAAAHLWSPSTARSVSEVSGSRAISASLGCPSRPDGAANRLTCVGASALLLAGESVA